MPLTPTDVHNVAFSKPPIGKRGYHEDEVDAFLDLVGAELARLIAGNKNLRNQVEQLDRQLRTIPADTGHNLRPLQPPQPATDPVPLRMKQTSPDGEHQVQAAKVLGLAQEIAVRLTGEAQTEADAILSDARNTSAHLLSQAKAKADSVVNETRTRTETMLHDARTRADTLDRQSREKAASLERDAARQHSAIIGSISQEKSILEKKIDELRMFEREYRTRLTIYLDSQLRKLDEHGSAAPTDPMRDRQDFAIAGFDAPAEPGNHRFDPTISRSSGAGTAKLSARTGPPESGIRDEPGTGGTRWKPVELNGAGARGVAQWPPEERSVS